MIKGERCEGREEEDKRKRMRCVFNPEYKVIDGDGINCS